MTVSHKEIAFEDAIEYHLLENGYLKRDTKDFDRKEALDPSIFFKFLESTQKKNLDKIKNHYKENFKEEILKRFNIEINEKGMIETLRKGITLIDITLLLVHFKPANNLNDDTLVLYQQNILTITRQVKFDPKSEKSLDMVISVNGIPVVTIELKNKFTSQNVNHAIKQYKETRDPKLTLFKFNTRSLIHFAVGPDEVYMATELKWSDSYFLPFNKGTGMGAGNPNNPDGYKTDYLWKEVLQRDSLLEILGKFIHLFEEKVEVDGKKKTNRILIFPRYHQLNAVRKLTQDVHQRGAGGEYLIQHSAGSGKSNSISWLTHQLSNLHDTSDKLIFDSAR
ncbi:MAG: hypothetical protein HeimC2_40090 [Candidatus Heimdallarchaeota archaeon LC_2]|nr:MAG: hypothetical protein HeimC2_40090 [Candidatus Heimdallarchaeota archaeon LC_2]